MQPSSRFCLAACVLMALMVLSLGSANAKSLYVITHIGTSTVTSYDIQTISPYLALQSSVTPASPNYGGVGIAIDSDAKILFITREGSANIHILDAITLTDLGTTTAPSASDLAGIVYDHVNQKLYCVDRKTQKLYSYSWNPATLTLTNDFPSPGYKILSQLNLGDASNWGGAHGLALDEVHGLLYVGDLSTAIKVYNTSDWSYAGSKTVTQKVMDVAVDVFNGLLYAGNASDHAYFDGMGLLCIYDLNNDVELTPKNIRSFDGASGDDNVVGIAVDPATGVVYFTTGDQTNGGSDRLIMLDAHLAAPVAFSITGSPTGLVVPGKDVGFNPLNLSVSDSPADIVCPGHPIQYTIQFDNASNAFDVHNVTLTANLSNDVDYTSSSGGGTHVAGTVTWNIGTLAANAGTSTITVDVMVNPDPGWNWLDVIPFSCTIDSDETPPTTKNESTVIDDIIPPTITVSVTPDLLWPPNHKMVTIAATVVVTDNCPCLPASSYDLISVASNEPDNGPGDGNTINDINILNLNAVELRAERSGLGSGRVYTLTYEATDCRGLTSLATATVTVPHSMTKFAISHDGIMTEDVSLAQNYPNPFNPATTITFSLPDAMHARLAVYDMLGREVAILMDGMLDAGTYSKYFSANDLPSGMYIVHLKTPDETRTISMRLLK